MPILHLLNFCFLFFINLSNPASAGNLLTTQNHFEIAAGSISDFLRILISTVKRVLGFGTPYYFANVVIIVITILNIIVYKLLENSDSDQKSSSSSNSNLSSEKKLCRFFSLDEIVSATNNFDESLVIGKGGFGKVYKGVIDNGSCTVAIKRLNPLSGQQGSSEFWAEIKMLSKFRHSHLVSLIGYCDQNKEMILVYEFMIHGSLDHYLHNVSKNDKPIILSWVQRLKICIGAARGLDYLHTGTAVIKRVIHRDVKSSNILLDENWAAKISDFGLSRVGPADRESTHVSTKHISGTRGYMDPEYFLTYRFTWRTDVYAFGVVLLEVLSERPAVDHSLPDEDQWSLAGWGQKCINDGAPHHLIGPNLKWEILQNSLMEFVQIACQCLQSRLNRRPTMSEVVVKLELAMSLQLRTNELTDDDLLVTDWPFGSSENTVSSANSDQIVQGGDGDSSSKPEKTTVSGSLNYRHLYKNIKFPFKLPKINLKKWKIPEDDLKVHFGQLRRFSLRELEVATDKFSNRHILGRGGFVKVYKGRLNDGTLVAVKRFKEERTQSGELQFKAEAEMIGINMAVHRNLLPVQGFCMTSTERIIVYPYMANGTVASWLRDRPDTQSPLDWSKRKQIALGSAVGLAYLHKNRVIHRDVKPANIFLDEEFEAAVGNYELARLIDYEDTGVTTCVCGSLGYLDPEYFSTAKASPKSDVYSYGVMLLELITGKRVIDFDRPDGVRGLAPWAYEVFKEDKVKTLDSVVDTDLIGNYIEEEVLQLIHIALLCTQFPGYKRPEMAEVVRMLEGDDLSERWEEWWKENVYRQESNNADHPNADQITFDYSFNIRPEELSGPR